MNFIERDGGAQNLQQKESCWEEACKMIEEQAKEAQNLHEMQINT